jgi:hypothetical protein
MSEPTANACMVVGVKPWLPWPLKVWSWWTEPVRAERLATLRIGLAAVLLVDVLGTYLPLVGDFFGSSSLGAADVFAKVQARFPWSLAGRVEDPRVLLLATIAWALAAGLLLVGLWSRVSAAAAWMVSQSFFTLNPNIHNAGDVVRTIFLFYLMLSPCGAVWSVDSWLRRRNGSGKAVCIYPWVLRLLFVQMTVIYFYNGLFKLMGADWKAGDSLYYVLGDLTTARLSYAQLPLPFWMTQLLTWTVLAWEVGFPLLVVLKPTRTLALFMGAALHVGIGLSLELGMFSLYMLCFYLPLVPWERYGVFPHRLVTSDLPSPLP